WRHERHQTREVARHRTPDAGRARATMPEQDGPMGLPVRVRRDCRAHGATARELYPSRGQAALRLPRGKRPPEDVETVCVRRAPASTTPPRLPASTTRLRAPLRA